jgi:predicted outer membrane repeat protein
MLPCSEIGKSSESRPLVVTNSGDTPVSIDHLLVPAPFYSDFRPAAPGPIWLNPGEDLTVGLRCIAENPGGICDSIQIIASYQGISRYRRVEIRGYGVPETGQTVSQLSAGTVWRADQSPYYINQSLSVPPGGHLVIEKGTRIFFTGPYQLTIGPDARLSVRGSAADSVYITGIQAETGWRGILLQDSGNDDTLSYCTISGVSALRGQNALSIRYSDPYIAHCLFTDNRSTFYGGALYMLGSGAIISDCVFRSNTCTARDGGGAIHLGNDSSPLLTNLLIYANQAKNGGAIYCDGSRLVLRNLTITGNTALGKGAAIYLAGTNQMEISNTIIWNNAAHLSPSDNSERLGNIESCFIRYSDIDTSSWMWISEKISSTAGKAFDSGAGNCYADPLFVNPVQNDFTLAFNSPCLDRGDPLADCSMEPQPNGGRINMGAFGGTVQATISTVTIAHDQSVPQSFGVSQNYPNPFNAVTIIDVILPSSEDVDLEIYNIIGQRIITLSYKMLPAGRHQIKIDGGNLASGIYIYRLLAGPHHDVKKMTVIK